MLYNRLPALQSLRYNCRSVAEDKNMSDAKKFEALKRLYKTYEEANMQTENPKTPDSHVQKLEQENAELRELIQLGIETVNSYPHTWVAKAVAMLKRGEV